MVPSLACSSQTPSSMPPQCQKTHGRPCDVARIEKSSAIVVVGISGSKSVPKCSAKFRESNLVMASSLVVVGKCRVMVKVGGWGQPLAVHSAVTMRCMEERSFARVEGLTLRMSMASVAVSAMMFSICPAWREPTVRTEMSEGLISRLMMVWRRTTTWAARRAGSIVRWGWGCQFWFFFFLFGGEENSPKIHAHQPQTA